MAGDEALIDNSIMLDHGQAGDGEPRVKGGGGEDGRKRMRWRRNELGLVAVNEI